MKKVLSLLTAAVMAVTMILPVSAAGTDSALKSAMTIAKQRVDIPKEYTEFDYDKYSTDGSSYYSMNWFPSDRSANINVVVSGKVIYNISVDDSSAGSYDEKLSFGEKSRSQLIKLAKSKLKVINPTIYKKLVIDEDSFVSSLSGTNATLHFYRYENGIKVYNNDGSITLDKNTGELKGFSLSWFSGATFADPENALSLKDAEKAFSSEYEIEPVYRLVPNYDEQKYDVTVLYIQKNYDDIDAFTGKISDFNANFYGNGYWTDEVSDDCDEDTLANGDKGDVEFNEDELKAIEANNNLLTTDKITEMLKANPEIKLSDDMPLKSYVLDHDLFDEDTYVWSLSYVSKNYSKVLNAHVDAQTGKIIAFNQFTDSTNIKASEFDQATAQKKAEAFAKEQMGSKKFGKYKLTSTYLWTYTDRKTGVEYATDFNITFDRYENGLRVDGDSISFIIYTDYSISSYMSTYTKATFKKAEILTKEQAFDKLFEQIQPTISYKCNINYENKKYNKTTALLYSLDVFTLDAKTGGIVDYYGNAIGKNTATYGNYTDIKDKELKKIAELLEDYGVALKTVNGKLKPNSAISEEDFIDLIGQLYLWNDSSEKPAASITRAEAVKTMISTIYGSEIAELKGIFKSPFSDVKDSSKYVGYAAIANAKGIVAGDKLNPNDKLTKADALRWVYNYIINS